MLEVEPHAEGCVLRIRAMPGARREGILGPHGGALKVAVRAPREKGKANKAIVKVLSTALRVKQSKVTLLSGTTSPDKRFLVRGLTDDDVRSRLAT